MTEVIQDSKLSASNVTDSADYSSYEVEKYYYHYFPIWLTILFIFNLISSWVTTPKPIRLVIIACWALAGLVLLIWAIKKGKRIKLTLFSDTIMIDELYIQAAELKSITLYQGSGYIDLFKKQGFPLANMKRLVLNNKEARADLQRELKIFCEQHGIALRNY